MASAAASLAGGPQVEPLRDAQGRSITYLRLSVTDRCNFRCTYCSPASWGGRSRLLSVEATSRLVSALAPAGIRRVRLTGGEPLFRPELLELARAVAAVPGIEELCLTTNGHALAELAAPLRAAGLKSVNVSLDTLDAARFQQLSGGRGELSRVIAGVDAALAAGLEVKLNAVVVAGVNEQDVAGLVRFAWGRGVVVRFIECMPFREGEPVASARLVERLAAEGLLLADSGLESRLPRGPARYLRGASGEVGFISPMSDSFCGGCNRMRVSASGELRACLGGRSQVPLAPLLDAEPFDAGALRAAVREALGEKPEGHRFLERSERSALLPMMGIGG